MEQKTDLLRFAEHDRYIYGSWVPISGPLGLDQFGHGWMMEYQERLALIALLEPLRPRVALEVGTHRGGSLAVLRAFAEKVYSLDIDPTCGTRLGRDYPGVEFIAGPSRQTLPPLIRRLGDEGA